MSRLLNATEVIGLPVVTLGGDDLAEVRDVVYEPDRGGLIGFTLNKRGFFSGRQKQVLTIDSVRSVGRDAVVVDDADALTDKSDGKGSVGAASSDRDVIGASVITDQGVALGTVSDVVISLGRKVEAVGYELVGSDDDNRRFFIPLPDQLAVSGDALMVPNKFNDFVRDDLTGFGGAIDAYRADHGSGHPGRGKAKGTSDAGGDSGSDSSRSKADLYAEARKLDISGRSSMTKAELVSALTEERGER
jgi:uncharacterized protein YrrD